MKKFITYIAIFAALATVSCTRSETEFGMKDSSLLSITLNPDEMATRASAISDVEEVISQFDWFFYPDATGTSAPVYHGHVTVGESGLTFSGNEPDASRVDENGYHLGFNVKTNYADLKGSYYVYVLANYDGIDHNASDLKLTTLLAKTMETQWDELNDDEVAGPDYEDIADFVMDSYSGDDKAKYPQLVPLSAAKAGIYFTETAADGEGILTVGLRRVAAKMTFTLNISERLPDPSNNGTYWRPLTKSSNFVAYLVNAVSYAEVKGEPQDAEDMAPERITGNTVITGGHQISYDSKHAKTATDADEEDEDYSPLVWELDPFYTYPVEFETESNNAPYLKIALPWENVDADGNLVNQGATLFYYKVYLYDPDTKEPLASYERNNHYIVAVNVNVLGGSPEDYTTLKTNYYVADWQAPAGGTYGGYMAPRYLDVRSEYYIYGDNSTTIAVTSSHPISTQIRSVSQKTISGGNKMTTVPSTAKATPDGRVAFTFEYPLNTTMAGGDMDITLITWTVRVSHADDSSIYEDVTIYQYPSIYGEQRRTGYAATAPSSSFSNTTDARYTFLNATRYNYSGTGTAVQANNAGVYLGSINGGSPESRDKLILTVTTLASLQDVIAFKKDGTNIKFSDVAIGDPRVRISTLWGEDALTHQDLTWSRTDLGQATNYIDNYLVASPDNNKYIAPRFMFPAGRLGSNRINSDLETGGSWRANAERCAAYQEGGYPAGRWRLPTEAEVAFCKQLQDEGYISGMYYPGNRYWTASGTYYLDGEVIDPADEADSERQGTGKYRTASSRCVYDLWYWGEDPYNNDKQHIKLENVEWVNPATSNTPANTWLGFMTE